MPCEEGKYGDSLWKLVWKILNCLNSVSANVAALVTGGGSVGDSFGTASDVVVAAAGTRVQGPNIATPRGVLVSADDGNTGTVYIGGSNVTNGSGNVRGLQLSVLGMSSQVLTVQNANQIYVNADTNGDRIGILIL